jgi:hypothetical protein
MLQVSPEKNWCPITNNFWQISRTVQIS